MILASEDDETVPISALQHLVYCERQAALIHVERVWADNALTTLGGIVHSRTDKPGRDQRRGYRVERSVELRSRRLKLHGTADAVEWSQRGPRPVETKRGPVVDRLADRVQLCAQALCLEEMLGVPVDCGILFYAQSHRRVEVELTAQLRDESKRACERMHEIISSAKLPAPEPGPKCKQCSLVVLCQPHTTAKNVKLYVSALFDGE